MMPAWRQGARPMIRKLSFALGTVLVWVPVFAQEMPRDHQGPRPKRRTRAEVSAVLAGAPEPLPRLRWLRVLLVAGKKDHGPGEHDYPAWQKAWTRLLARAG